MGCSKNHTNSLAPFFTSLTRRSRRLTTSVEVSSCITVNEIDDSSTVLKKDWVRRFENFANNYCDGDIKKAEYCLKDSYLLHKWNKIQKNLKPIEWKTDLTAKKYVDVDTIGSAACVGGACEIDF